MTLEEITKAAEAYAMNCWWQAHDEKDWAKVKDHITIFESVLTRYTGKLIDASSIGEPFVEALKAYDEFTDILKKEGLYGPDQLIVTKGKIHEYLAAYYSAIIGPESNNHDIAEATTGWWTSWAKSKMFYKKGDMNSYENANRDTLEFLKQEHKLRFNVDEDTARGLAHSLLSAAYLGHNKKDWAKAEKLLKVYCIELFSALTAGKT